MVTYVVIFVVLLVAGVSFIDDIRSLPDSVRLIAQFSAAALAFYQLGMLNGAWFEANGTNGVFFDQLLVMVAILSVVVFCLFNFSPKGKAKCFAGDVGSIGIAFIMLFLIGKVIIATGDLTYLIFLLVYGVDGVLTICHRIMPRPRNILIFTNCIIKDAKMGVFLSLHP